MDIYAPFWEYSAKLLQVNRAEILAWIKRRGVPARHLEPVTPPTCIFDANSLGTNLQERLGADLSSYPIPDGFERKEAAMGKGKREAVAWTQSYGYQTTKLRQIRAALVNGGPNIQVA
jgi:hypothetical protein